MSTDLEELQVLEVSLVKTGANRKKFALWKGEETMLDLTAAILSAPSDDQTDLQKIMVTKGLSKEARATVGDAYKLLSAVKEEMSMGLYKELKNALGLKGMEDEKEDDSEEKAEDSQAPMGEDEAPAEAPPEAEEKAEGDDEAPPEAEEKAEGDDEEDAQKAVPVTIQQQNQALAKSDDPKLIALYKTVADLQKVNKAHEDKARTKQFIEKADKAYPVVPGASPKEVGLLLRDLDAVDPKLCQRVEAIVKAANAFASNSGLLGEVGTSNAGASPYAVGNSDAEIQLEGMAKQRIAKTGESFAIAYEKVLMDNQALYNKSVGLED